MLDGEGGEQCGREGGEQVVGGGYLKEEGQFVGVAGGGLEQGSEGSYFPRFPEQRPFSDKLLVVHESVIIPRFHRHAGVGCAQVVRWW